jgi:hypothetical protein
MSIELAIPTREEIEKRAYELYLARGCESGRDVEDWLAAERELTIQHELVAPIQAMRKKVIARSVSSEVSPA